MKYRESPNVSEILKCSLISSFQADAEIYWPDRIQRSRKDNSAENHLPDHRPDSGKVLLDGKPVYENAAVKQKSFFMTEEATYFAQSDLLGMRKFYKGYYPEWSDKTFYGLIDLFGVSPRMKISRFSKGMQRQAD